MAEQIDREELGEAKKTLGEVEQNLGHDDRQVTGANGASPGTVRGLAILPLAEWGRSALGP
jgi:hypothetical protein